MHRARGINGIFEQGAAGLVEYFSKSVRSFLHFYQQYRQLPEDLNRYSKLEWDMDSLKGLYGFLYAQMEDTTGLPAKFIQIVEELEDLATKAHFSLPLRPSYHDDDFREQWKCQNATYVTDRKDVDMNTAHEDQQPATTNDFSQSLASSINSSHDLDTDMSEAPPLSSLQHSVPSLIPVMAPSAMPSNSFFAAQPASQAVPSAQALNTGPATAGTLSDEPTKPMGLFTSVHAANTTPSAPGPTAPKSSKASAKALFSAPFTTADDLAQALDSHFCIAELKTEMIKISAVVLRESTLCIAHFPFVKATVEAVSKAKGNNFARVSIAKATSWQAEMHTLRGGLKTFNSKKMQPDTRQFFGFLCALSWIGSTAFPSLRLLLLP